MCKARVDPFELIIKEAQQVVGIPVGLGCGNIYMADLAIAAKDADAQAARTEARFLQSRAEFLAEGGQVGCWVLNGFCKVGLHGKAGRVVAGADRLRQAAHHLIKTQ